MNTLSTGVKFLMSIVVLCAVLWFGGSVVRMAIGYDLFIPGTLSIKPFLSPSEINYSIRIFSLAGFYTAVCYAITWLSSVILIIAIRKKLKANGWLFMAFVLFFLASPIELYQMQLDIKLLLFTQNYDFRSLLDSQQFFELFMQKFTPKLSGLGFASIFANGIAFLYCIWQPLKRGKE
ncbi:MAG: hypothetical protein HYZ54_10090 [Ignavibacteriae bacterium]|nr:hypothetical protein [Ignavibacteriota bacterium]